METENNIKSLIRDGKTVPGCFAFDVVERDKEIEKEILKIIGKTVKNRVFRRHINK